MVCASVAAASIMAKVTRDRMMDRYHRRFPLYGFDQHSGYGTAAHRAAIARFGPSPDPSDVVQGDDAVRGGPGDVRARCTAGTAAGDATAAAPRTVETE